MKCSVGAKLEVDVVETCSVDPGPQQYHAAPRRVLQHMRAHTTREGTGKTNPENDRFSGPGSTDYHQPTARLGSLIARAAKMDMGLP